VLAALGSGDLERLISLLRSSGMPEEEAGPLAAALLRNWDEEAGHSVEIVGSALGASLSSFCAFALGALVPVVPYLVADGGRALVGAVVLTGIALFIAGTTAGILTGGPLLSRGLRQLSIGGVAAAVTYGLGRLLGVTIT
jgi:vacuolar iron transporter family protein